MIFTRQFFGDYTAMKKYFFLLLLVAPFSLLAHELDYNEKDSGKYVSKVKVRDYYFTPVSTGERRYDRSNITFKYDGKQYTVNFEKKGKFNILAKTKKTWSSSPEMIN